MADSVSFLNYKINYDVCLGSGSLGAVYEIVERPDNERGFFAVYCPYLYDYLFRVDQETKAVTPLVVKISHTALKTFLISSEKLCSWSWGYKIFRDSFSELNHQRTTNKVLRKFKVSEIVFYSFDSIYTQFKTRIAGHTFYYYLENNFFIKPQEYKLRQTFIHFLQLISQPGLFCSDLHGGNIMYDEQKHRWEIVDGYATEVNPIHEKFAKIDNVERMFFSLFGTIWEKPYLFEKLNKYAKDDRDYTPELDQKVVQKAFNSASRN